MKTFKLILFLISIFQFNGLFSQTGIERTEGCGVNFTYFVGPSFEVSFLNTSLSPAGFHWDFGDGDTSILTSPTHQYAMEGDYEITLSLVPPDTCVSTYSAMLYLRLSDNIETNLNEDFLSIYPNPFTSELFINSIAVKPIAVKDIFGKNMNVAIIDLGYGQYMVHTEDLSAGIYFIEMNSQTNSILKSIIKLE